MRVVIIGTNLPGATFCEPDGTPLQNVHVGVQLGPDPEQLVRGDASEARWELDVQVVETSDGVDFSGQAVQGKRGERFIYLTWGNVDAAGHFHRFRRAKLMLNRVDTHVIRTAEGKGSLTARVRLSDDRGAPRCAHVTRQRLAGPPNRDMNLTKTPLRR